jgi:pimeloyl-ACP methyl ester carboxylesterase
MTHPATGAGPEALTQTIQPQIRTIDLWDWAVPPSNPSYLTEQLPHSGLDLIDAGHFTWEDAPEEYAGLVTGWWEGGHARV